MPQAFALDQQIKHTLYQSMYHVVSCTPHFLSMRYSERGPAAGQSTSFLIRASCVPQLLAALKFEFLEVRDFFQM
eukprot:1161646-Pelagomonas_calceolata.AAC.15